MTSGKKKRKGASTYALGIVGTHSAEQGRHAGFWQHRIHGLQDTCCIIDSDCIRKGTAAAKAMSVRMRDSESVVMEGPLHVEMGGSKHVLHDHHVDGAVQWTKTCRYAAKCCFLQMHY